MKRVLLRAESIRAPITIAVARGRTSFFLAEIPLEFQQEKRICLEITPPATECLNAQRIKSYRDWKIAGDPVLAIRDRLEFQIRRTRHTRVIGVFLLWRKITSTAD